MKYRLIALMTGLAMTNIASAAVEIDLHHQPFFYMKNKLAQQSKDSKIKIEIVRSDIDLNGTIHTRIQESYEGIPVWDATGIIHTPQLENKLQPTTRFNAMSTMNGMIYEDLEKDLAVTAQRELSKDAAQNALQLAKTMYIRQSRIAAQVSFSDEKSLPIIFIDENKKAHHAFLTSFTYVTSSSIHRPTSIIDATTSRIYKNWDGIFTENAQEKAQQLVQAKLTKMVNSKNSDPDFYDIDAGGVGGNVKKELLYDGIKNKALKMKAIDLEIEIFPDQPYKVTFCALTNDDIEVVDVSTDNSLVFAPCSPHSKAHNGVAWLSIDKAQTRWNNDEMNEGYSPSLDAFYDAMIIKNMYQDWFKVPALIESDGKPMQYVMRTHFGRKFDNAFWDGRQMTFGDGGNLFYPLTSVGVAAHEISHGFTETHSNIDGSKPQMAALHESFSDMAAVAIEYYLTGTNKWEIGREIKKDEGALRYLDHPTKDGHSIDHMNDFDATEPHAAAGITNKAFYLLATSKGWNTRKAFEVMATANMHYWNSSINTFDDASCGVISATKEYKYNTMDVRMAFEKVGIHTDNCT